VIEMANLDYLLIGGENIGKPCLVAYGQGKILPGIITRAPISKIAMLVFVDDSGWAYSAHEEDILSNYEQEARIKGYKEELIILHSGGVTARSPEKFIGKHAYQELRNHRDDYQRAGLNLEDFLKSG
jgi:hypothetical protein